jgi:hypothetical protein
MDESKLKDYQNINLSRKEMINLFKPFYYALHQKSDNNQNNEKNNQNNENNNNENNEKSIKFDNNTNKIINNIQSPNEVSCNNFDNLLYFKIKYRSEFDNLIPIILNSIEHILLVHSSFEDISSYKKHYFYYTESKPVITLRNYIERIAETSCISPSTLISMLIILDRLYARNLTLIFSYKNIYRIIAGAIRIASKVNELRSLNNDTFCPIVGLSLKELNDIEAYMLIDLQFDLYISPELFNQYLTKCYNTTPESIPFPKFYEKYLKKIEIL